MLQDGEHYCHSLTGLFGKLVFVQRERVGFKEVIKKNFLKRALISCASNYYVGTTGVASKET